MPGEKSAPRNEATSHNHTMGASLERYLEIKVHQKILQQAYREIVVVGRYGRYAKDSIVFEGEKRDKPFNWERPSARVEDGKLFVDCFPGYDHVEHYAEIIACYLSIKQKAGTGVQLTASSNVFFVPASCSDTRTALAATNLPAFPGTGIDTVVLGLVWHLPRLTGTDRWLGDGPWQWIIKTFGTRKVAFLGFRPAFWGDISGEVVHWLATNFRIEEVIYLGKLGALKPEIAPNQWLATGGRSLVNRRWVKWQDTLEPAISRCGRGAVIFGSHVTLGSVLHETKKWHAEMIKTVDFVDPEIGMMAQAAVRSGIKYNYLHIITDNLGKKYDEDLSNERKEKVLKRRARLYNIVEDVLEAHLSRPDI